MSRHDIVRRLEASGLVAIVRADTPQGLVEICSALADGGITATEITLTTPGALPAIETAAKQLQGRCLIGAGSVLDGPTASTAISAGAEYIVSPVTRRDVIDTAHRYGKAVVPGALTPTEILDAWEAGADLVKVFPANHFGPRYFKDVLAPMPQLRLTPTGGVNLDTATEWLAAGAACLGVGSALIKKDLIAKGDWKGITSLAKQFVGTVDAYRAANG